MSEKDDLNSRLIRELEETLKSEEIEIDENDNSTSIFNY